MSRAVKVVARQLRELQDDPIENVAIQPTESNFLVYLYPFFAHLPSSFFLELLL